MSDKDNVAVVEITIDSEQRQHPIQQDENDDPSETTIDVECSSSESPEITSGGEDGVSSSSDDEDEEEEEEDEEEEGEEEDDDDESSDEDLYESDDGDTIVDFLFPVMPQDHNLFAPVEISYERLYINVDTFVKQYYENWTKKMNRSSIATLIIDIRDSKSFQESHLFGSINIPIGSEKLTEFECMRKLENEKYDLLFDWIQFYNVIIYAGSESPTGNYLKCTANKRTIKCSELRKNLCYDPSDQKNLPLVSFVNVFLKSYYFFDLCQKVNVLQGGWMGLRMYAKNLIHSAAISEPERLKECEKYLNNNNNKGYRKRQSQSSSLPWRLPSLSSFKRDHGDRGAFIQFDTAKRDFEFSNWIKSKSISNDFGINFRDLEQKFTKIIQIHLCIKETYEKKFLRTELPPPVTLAQLKSILDKISLSFGSGFVFVTSDPPPLCPSAVPLLLSICIEMMLTHQTLGTVLSTRQHHPSIETLFDEFPFTDDQWKLLFEFDADSLDSVLNQPVYQNYDRCNDPPPVKLRHFPSVSIKHLYMYQQKSLTFRESLPTIPSLGEIAIIHKFRSS